MIMKEDRKYLSNGHYSFFLLIFAMLRLWPVFLDPSLCSNFILTVYPFVISFFFQFFVFSSYIYFNCISISLRHYKYYYFSLRPVFLNPSSFLNPSFFLGQIYFNVKIEQPISLFKVLNFHYTNSKFID